jgi:hypothetical protein
MKFLGNTSDIINWECVYQDLQKSKSDNWVLNLLTDIDPPPEIYDQYKKDQNKIFQPLVRVGYHNMNHLRWRVFRPGVDFDEAVDQQLADFIDCDRFYSWISCMEPGCMIPMHRDLYKMDVMKTYYENRDRTIRCSIHIAQPEFGHVFVCEDTCYYNQPVGNVYLWDDPQSIHGGCNFGIQKKYLYNFLGLKK